MVGVFFALPLVMFSVVVTIFLCALGLLRIFSHVGYILFRVSLGGDVEQPVIDVLVGKVIFCHEIFLNVLYRGGDFVEEKGGLCMRGFQD